MDEDGYVFLVDRKKDLIKTSGFQVWPREIEEVISAHPAVMEVGVAGVPDAAKGEVAKAYVVLKEGQSATEDAIRAYCRERLAPYKVPASVEFRNVPAQDDGGQDPAARARGDARKRERPDRSSSPRRGGTHGDARIVQRRPQPPGQLGRARRVAVDAQRVHRQRHPRAIDGHDRLVRAPSRRRGPARRPRRRRRRLAPPRGASSPLAR